MSKTNSTMPGRSTLRKLGIVLLVLALAAGAGCSGITGGDGGGGDANLLENVPQEQNVLIEIDMDLLTDDTTQQLMQEGGDEGEAPSEQDLDEGFSEIEEETGLDPRDVHRVLVFGQTDDVADPMASSGANEQVGILVSTDWSVEELNEAFQGEGDSELEEQDYEESGVFYRVSDEGDDDPTYLGVLGGGTYVLGDEASVRASLDTEYAGAGPLDGELVDAYESTSDGLVTMAMLMPQDEQVGGTSQFGEIRAFTGVYYTSGSDVGLEGRLIFASADDAQQFQQLVQFAMMGAQDDPELAELMNNLDVSQDGTDVTFTFESDVETLVEASDSA